VIFAGKRFGDDPDSWLIQKVENSFAIKHITWLGRIKYCRWERIIQIGLAANSLVVEF